MAPATHLEVNEKFQKQNKPTRNNPNQGTSYKTKSLEYAREQFF